MLTTIPWLWRCVLIRNQTGIVATIRRTALRETDASRHHEDRIEGTLKLVEHQSSMVSRGLMGPLVGTPWCQETSLFQTAVRLIVEVFPVCTRVFPLLPGVLSGDIFAYPDLDLHFLPSLIPTRGTYRPLLRTPLLLNPVPGTVISYALSFLFKTVIVLSYKDTFFQTVYVTVFSIQQKKSVLCNFFFLKLILPWKNKQKIIVY